MGNYLHIANAIMQGNSIQLENLILKEVYYISLVANTSADGRPLIGPYIYSISGHAVEDAE